MKLLKSLPNNRTLEQIENHYLVEKSIAARLRKASKEERKQIFATMYDELFEKVPDHPRLTQRNSKEQTRIACKSKMTLIREFLNPSTIFVEIAPGDCKFAMEVAALVKNAYGVDISDQRDKNDPVPENFSLIVYDGYRLDEIQKNTVDLVFSDQFIEHLHPDDIQAHFELVYQMLKPGGKYVFRTDHSFTGPHDISQYFSYIPEGFHLKEWSFIEFYGVLNKINFTKYYIIWKAKSIKLKLPYIYARICENMLDLIPRLAKRFLARFLLPSIIIVAIK
jgi:SAM-dependent methyltransferase